MFITQDKRPNNVLRLMYRAPYNSIIMMGCFTGSITSTALQTALTKARIKYPLLNSRILQKENGAIEFFYDYPADFPILTLTKNNPDDWIAATWENQKTAFNMQEGPLIKFLILSDGTTSDVVVICHHCICDGLSLAYLIKDLGRFLIDPNQEVEALPIPPTITCANLSTAAPGGFIDFFTRLLTNYLNRCWNKNRTIFSEADYQAMFHNFWQTKKAAVITFSLDKNLTAALIAKCKEKQVTVNSALTTAFSLAQKDLYGRKQRHLRKALLAISARNMFKEPQEENFGCLAIANQITLPGSAKGFWYNAKKFNTKIKDMLAHPRKFLALIGPLDYIEPTLFDAIYFVENAGFTNKAAVRFKNIVLSKTGAARRSMDITNIGVVRDVPPNLLTLYFVPMLSSNYIRTLGIATINGVLNISLMQDTTIVKPEDTENFKNRILWYLNQAIDN